MRIKEFRKLNGLYQKDLAKLLNLSEAAISQYESGLREPDMQTCCLLADYFKVTVDDLIGHTPTISTPLISDEELALIADYRRLGAVDQNRLKKMMAVLKNVATAEVMP